MPENNSYSAKAISGSLMHNIEKGTETVDGNYLKTGLKMVDEIMTLNIDNILLVAGGKGTGKTRFVLFLIDKLLNMNHDVAVKWHNMEMSNDTMILLLIARRVAMGIKQIMSKNYQMSHEQLEQIRAAMDEINNMDIEFCSKAISIKEVRQSFKHFTNKRPGKKCILVIDNLGLLTDNYSDVKSDDIISKEIVKIREETAAMVIPIHHMTKNQGSRSNAKDGYRPTVDDIRGSSRISDYANQVILLHKPSNYKDLMTQEQLKGTYTKSSGKVINRANTLKKLLIVDVAKNREDNLAIIRFKSQYEYARFQEWDLLNN